MTTHPIITTAVFGPDFANTFWGMVHPDIAITGRHNEEWPPSMVFFAGDEEILTLNGEEGLFHVTLGCGTVAHFVDVLPTCNRLTAPDFDAFVLFLAQACAAIPTNTPQHILVESEDDLLPSLRLDRLLA